MTENPDGLVWEDYPPPDDDSFAARQIREWYPTPENTASLTEEANE